MFDRCERCGEAVSPAASASDAALCGNCLAADHSRREARAIRRQRAQAEAEELKQREEERLAEAALNIVLTTEVSPGLMIASRLDIVTSEVALPMRVFKEAAAGLRDAAGNHGRMLQSELRNARKQALDGLRIETVAIGADAVVGVDLCYAELGTGGDRMLLLVAKGTAVTLERSPPGRTRFHVRIPSGWRPSFSDPGGSGRD